LDRTAEAHLINSCVDSLQLTYTHSDTLGFTWIPCVHLDSSGIAWIRHLDTLGFTDIPLGSLRVTLCIHLGSLELTWDQLDLLGIFWNYLDSLELTGVSWIHLDELAPLGPTLFHWDSLHSQLFGAPVGCSSWTQCLPSHALVSQLLHE
jgi:hypothetical protein